MNDQLSLKVFFVSYSFMSRHLSRLRRANYNLICSNVFNETTRNGKKYVKRDSTKVTYLD